MSIFILFEIVPAFRMISNETIIQFQVIDQIQSDLLKHGLGADTPNEDDQDMALCENKRIEAPNGATFFGYYLNPFMGISVDSMNIMISLMYVVIQYFHLFFSAWGSDFIPL